MRKELKMKNVKMVRFEAGELVFAGSSDGRDNDVSLVRIKDLIGDSAVCIDARGDARMISVRNLMRLPKHFRSAGGIFLNYPVEV